MIFALIGTCLAILLRSLYLDFSGPETTSFYNILSNIDRGFYLGSYLSAITMIFLKDNWDIIWIFLKKFFK